MVTSSDTNFALANCLFGEGNLIKNAHHDKYEYFGYGIGFGLRSLFSYESDWGINVIILGTDMNSS